MWGWWRNRNARLYLSMVIISGFGSSAMTLVAGVWVMSLTGSSSLAAFASFLVWAPTLVGPVIGALVDRVPRRIHAMAWINATMAVLLLLLVMVRSRDQLWLLFAVMLAYGVSYVALDAAESAVLPVAVPAELLGDVNGLRMSASEGTKLTAPLVGAGLFAWLGGAAVAGLDALTFAVAAALCLFIRPTQTRFEPDRSSWLRRIAEGGRQLWRHDHVRRLVLLGSSVMFLAGINGAMVFAVVDEGLARAPEFVGVLAAVQGVGSVVGGLVAGPLMQRLSTRVFMTVAITLFAAGVLLRATAWLVPVVAGTVAVGVGLPWALIAVATIVQRDIPSQYLGRVAGTVHMVTYAPGAAAQAVGAGLLAVLNYRVVLVAATVGGVVTGVLAAVSRLRPTPAGADGVGESEPPQPVDPVRSST